LHEKTGFDIAVGIKWDQKYDPHDVDLTGYLELEFEIFTCNNTVKPAVQNITHLNLRKCTEKDA